MLPMKSQYRTAFIYLFRACECASLYTGATGLACRQEDNSGESVLPLPHVGSGDRTQVCRFGSKGPKLLSHLTALRHDTYKFTFLSHCRNFFVPISTMVPQRILHQINLKCLPM